jgi:predicted membrane protein
MTEILIVALSHFVNLLLEIICGPTSGLAVVFVALPPMLKLVVSGAVEGFLTLAALEESLLATYLAAWSRAVHHFLHHSI